MGRQVVARQRILQLLVADPSEGRLGSMQGEAMIDWRQFQYRECSYVTYSIQISSFEHSV